MCGDIHTIGDCRSLKVVKKGGATQIVAEAAQAAGSVRALTSTFTCGLCATSMGRRIMRRRSSGRNQRSRWQRRASAFSRCCWPKGDRSSTRCLLRNLYSSVTRLCLVAFPEQRSAARELPNKLWSLSVEVCQAVRHGRVRRGCGCGGRAREVQGFGSSHFHSTSFCCLTQAEFGCWVFGVCCRDPGDCLFLCACVVKSWVSGQVRAERDLADAITVDGRKEWICKFCSETNVWTRWRCRR